MHARSQRFPLAVTSMVVSSLVMLSAGGARAYVRNVTSKGVPISWLTPCVSMYLYSGSPPPFMTAVQLFEASREAAATWSYPAVPATDLHLSVIAETQAPAEIGYDHRNVIVFRQDSWCRYGGTPQNTSSSDPSLPSDTTDTTCYSPSALAITSIFKNATTGEIVDADIELNAVYFSWSDRLANPVMAPTAPVADFQNTLTHELGHVVGLDHVCFSASDNHERLTDNTGAPEVDCYGSTPLPSSMTEATMYPSVELSDTSRRTLSPDDEQGVRDIYPRRQAACPVLIASGCSFVQAASAAATPAGRYESLTARGLVFVALVLSRRYKKRRDHRDSPARRAS